MLAVTSDWGLSDGSLCPTRAGRAVAWLEAIRLAVARSGWGDDGRYRPVAAATLVFAGDTFDWLLSDAWAGSARPWRGGRGAAETRARVATASVRAVLPVLRILRRWIRVGIPIPAADARGRPAPRRSASVAASAVLLAGDRDWWLPELAHAAERLGCPVGEEWSDGTRWIRHGHDLDPMASMAVPLDDGRERPPSLAESLAVDLLVPFATAARGEGNLWPSVRPVLAGLAMARPTTLPGRLAALLDGAAVRGGEGTRNRIASIFRSCVARWHAVARREVPACEAEYDVVDDLAAWLERLEATAAPPAAVARLERAAAFPRRPAAWRPDPAGPDAPALVMIQRNGRERRLPLAAAPPGPAVVAVGGGGAGTGYVDAA